MAKTNFERIMDKSYKDVYYMNRDMSDDIGIELPPQLIHEAAMMLFQFRASRRMQIVMSAEQSVTRPDDGRGTM